MEARLKAVGLVLSPLLTDPVQVRLRSGMSASLGLCVLCEPVHLLLPRADEHEVQPRSYQPRQQNSYQGPTMKKWERGEIVRLRFKASKEMLLG